MLRIRSFGCQAKSLLAQLRLGKSRSLKRCVIHILLSL